MITYLKVRNLAIVEELEIEPGPGFNVLTGETGAGKSLLIDSLGFLSGERGSTDSIRTGTDRMSAEAVFELSAALASELAGELPGDTPGELIVKREISHAGRSRVQMNGSLVQVRDLLSVTGRILQIHGQTSTHERIAGKNARELLDDFGGHGEIRSAVAERFEQWRERSGELDRLASAHHDRGLRLDLLRYQIDEISAARLIAGEEESLREQRTLLGHAQEIIDATSRGFTMLDEDELSASSQVARAAHLLGPLSARVASLRAPFESLEQIRIEIQEVSRDIAAIASETRDDPARLEAVEERLALIERLERKYGASVVEVLEHLEKVRGEHDQLADLDTNLERLRLESERALAAYRESAEKLSAQRGAAARKLEREIQSQLSELAMEAATVRIELSIVERAGSPISIGSRPVAFGADGFDRVGILAAPNRGEEPRPIERIASGGELSRIQLAIAAAIFNQTAEAAPATLVFDEIDAGIGGRVAEVVGRKLRALASNSQVLCVTHLPQIASLGSTHFVVWKEESGGRTRAQIRKLESADERVEEIARMLAGESISETARSHARELLAFERPSPAKKGRRA